MATDKREVELTLKANNLSSKTFKEVNASIEKFNATLNKQVEAAKKGDITTGELAATYRKLGDAGKALEAQERLILTFRNIASSLELAQEKALSAGTAYAALAEEQAYMGKVTAAQNRELVNLAKASDRANKELGKQQQNYADISASISKAGLSVGDLNSAQSALVESARKVTAAQTQASETIDNYAAGIRALRDAQRAQAKAEEDRLSTLAKAEAAERARVAAIDAEIAEMGRLQAVLAKTAESEQAMAAAFRVQHEQNAKFAKDAEYVRFWTESLDKAEKEERALAESIRSAANELDKQAVAAQKSAAAQVAAVQKAKAEAEKARKEAEAAAAKNPFESNGRTTLSLLQRIRGQVLAVTAAYVGLQGIIGGVASVLQSSKDMQQIQSKLLVSNGNDARAAGEEYQYLRGQAERLGEFLPDLAKQYSSFAIAAKAANMNTQDMRFVFERVAEAGKVMQLDNENMQGIFNAITQIVSKGKVQSEELRGQLGDRLPGAIVYAAKKYEGGVKEFTKQLEKGNVEATNGVINLARGLDEAFNKSLEGAVQSIGSKENRFKNSLFEFKQIIANSGLTDA